MRQCFIYSFTAHCLILPHSMYVENSYPKLFFFFFLNQGSLISSLSENNHPGQGFQAGFSEKRTGEGHQEDGNIITSCRNQRIDGFNKEIFSMCCNPQVSENKRRYQKDGFDLDLTYVTGSWSPICPKSTETLSKHMCASVDRVIAMSFPSSGKQSFYRNPIKVGSDSPLCSLRFHVQTRTEASVVSPSLHVYF